MKIIINAYQYSSSITGTDRMARNYLAELQKLDKKNEYFIICSQETYTRSVIVAENFHLVSPPQVPQPHVRRVVNKLWRESLESRLKKHHADVYYSFHNLSLPNKPVAKKHIASNLDIIPLALPEYEGLNGLSRKEQLAAYTNTCKMADAIISISDFSKQELVKVVGVPEEKIHVVYLAADPELQNSEPQDIVSLGVKKPYFFVIGGSEPRKNVQTVVDAYNQLPEKIQRKISLVIGGGNWRNKILLNIDTPNIINLGYFDEKYLKSLYVNATAFVFASHYEGFGFTILEAMSLGVPVINSRGTSLDEVAGEATLTFSSKNTEALTTALEKVALSLDLQRKLSVLGKTQAKKFSWEKSTKKLHKLLTGEHYS